MISSIITESPKSSGIYHISGTNIQLLQVSEQNYFFADSYDNYINIYFGEYNENITVSDIIDINQDIFK